MNRTKTLLKSNFYNPGIGWFNNSILGAHAPSPQRLSYRLIIPVTRRDVEKSFVRIVGIFVPKI